LVKNEEYAKYAKQNKQEYANKYASAPSIQGSEAELSSGVPRATTIWQWTIINDGVL
jgi:hypothetical protein